MKRFVALFLVGLSAIVASAQIPSSDGTWGEPVEGVQLRLELAKSLPPYWQPPSLDELMKRMPLFDVQIRNQGATAVTAQLDALDCAQIEVDGIWYRQGACAIGTLRRPAVISPGSLSDVSFVHFQVPIMFEPNTQPMRKFELRPGTHRVRLQIPKFRDEILPMHPTDEKEIALISNFITIDVPGSAAGQIKP